MAQEMTPGINRSLVGICNEINVEPGDLSRIMKLKAGQADHWFYSNGHGPSLAKLPKIEDALAQFGVPRGEIITRAIANDGRPFIAPTSAPGIADMRKLTPAMIANIIEHNSHIIPGLRRLAIASYLSFVEQSSSNRLWVPETIDNISTAV